MFSFSIDNVVGDPVEQGHITGHRQLELLFKKIHLKSDRLLYLFCNFQMLSLKAKLRIKVILTEKVDHYLNEYRL